MQYRIVYTPEAREQLRILFRYIAHEASRQVAKRYTDAIMAHCEKLTAFPHRGTPRDDVRPGMRTLSFRRRVTITYTVREGAVLIIGVFYGGQDFETLLNEDD